ncbi:MAG: YggS family pyridoxal phosphate-dependent enzyme [Eggerthellaceae bacterium]|jgi:pyridoxal phosphate enzyme (YggS family)|nr:YggS family pyridoxal phosphate-dependent enzyme [Eggerthellaceae bacterium]MCH4220874.1 YggS family pyridoxal phosphate-dependent enzyme [Eggerthellaceae bacterium]
MGIADRYRKEYDNVAHVCAQCGRDPSEVTLIAVSKTVDLNGVKEAFDAGARNFGENRPDQIVQKQQVYPSAQWHFIGNVQSRRIADIVRTSCLIHSVYQEHHLPKIEAAAAHIDKIQDILLEVNVSGEESKHGAAPDDLPQLLKVAAQCPHIRVCGLMTMAPQGDATVARSCFHALAQLRDTVANTKELCASNIQLSGLSMGMSEDWQYAIEEGATMVRIGRAIFSDDFN